MKGKHQYRSVWIGVLLFFILSGRADPAGAWKAVSAGWYHTCAIRNDGTVACWGYNQNGQAAPPSGIFTQLGAGFFHTCGIQFSLGVTYPVCWGNNDDNQAPPFIALPFTQVSGGEFTSCGLRPSGSALCWGRNIPGIGQTEPPAYTFVQIDCGDNHSCGIRAGGGSLACWGQNNYGQASPPSGNFYQVSGGNEYTCGVRSDGTLACWGTNTDGQKVPPSGTFKQVSAGGFHACGVRMNGTVACWGLNSSGQATPPVGNFTEVSCGGFHTCGLRTDGTVTCWGSNGFGQAPILTLSPPGLAIGLLGKVYNQAITAAGGTAPFTFALTAGSLPPGLALTPAGMLSGTPTTVGVYGFTVSAADSNLFYTEKAYSLIVRNPGVNLPVIIKP